MKLISNTLQKVYIVLWATGLFLIPTRAKADYPRISQITDLQISSLLNNVINWILGFAGGIAVLFIVYGGIIYITGAEKGAERGKTILTNAIIGLVIIILSYAIVAWVNSAIGGIGK